jgi:hypothetical protein
MRREKLAKLGASALCLCAALLALAYSLCAAQARRQREAVATLHQLGHRVEYEFAWTARRRTETIAGPFGKSRPLVDEPQVAGLFGLDLMGRVVAVNAAYREVAELEAALPHLRRLPHLKTLNLYDGGFCGWGNQDFQANRAAVEALLVRELPQLEVHYGGAHRHH